MFQLLHDFNKKQHVIAESCWRYYCTEPS